MKKIILSSLLTLFFFGIGSAQYDDVVRSGYEGDFFSLEGALELFKESSSVRNFERKLNSEEYYVNNLDLNQDGQTDYIRVEHKRSGRYHAIIMQAILNRREVQDVAVIEFERTRDYEVLLQIVGDEDLYGERVVIESYDENWGQYGNRGYNDRYVNAYHWPVVQWIFAPRYVTYVSPYSFAYYPGWYRPWNRCGWNVYYPRIVRYRRFCRVAPVYRLTNVYTFYRPYRRYCPSVRQNTGYVRNTRGRNSYYFGSNGRSRQGYSGRNGIANNNKTRTSTTRIASKKPRSNFSSTRSNTGKSTRPPKVNKPNLNTRTSSVRPTSRPSTTRPSSSHISKRPTRKPSVNSSRKPTVRSTPKTSVRKPTRKPNISKSRNSAGSKPSVSKPRNAPIRKPSVSKRPASRSRGISRGSNQVRKQTSRSSTRPPARSKFSKKPNRPSKPQVRPSSKGRSNSRSSGNFRSNSSRSSSKGKRH